MCPRVGPLIANGFTVMFFPSRVAGQDWAGQLLPGLASPLLPGQRSVLYCPLCFLFPHNTGALQLGPSSYTIQPPSHCFTLYFILSHFPSVPLSSFSSEYISLLIIFLAFIFLSPPLSFYLFHWHIYFSFFPFHFSPPFLALSLSISLSVSFLSPLLSQVSCCFCVLFLETGSDNYCKVAKEMFCLFNILRQKYKSNENKSCRRHS